MLGPWLLGRVGAVLAGIALVAVAGSRFGADGGGLLVLLAAYATLLVRARGVALDTRRAVALVGAALLVGIALVGLDAAFGGSSHVTQAVGDGPGAVLGDVVDRIELSARRTFDAIGPAFAVLASLVVVAYVATRRPRRPVTDAVLVALARLPPRQRHAWRRRRIGAVAAFVVLRFEDGSRSRRADPPG